MTRQSDVRVPIVTRAEIGQALDPIAFLSVHFNAGTNARSEIPGTEMYHQIENAGSKRLAGLLYEETRAVLDQFDIPWVALGDSGTTFRPNQAGGDYYGVLRRPAPVVSVLLEFAYLSNPAEEELVSDPAVQGQLAHAVLVAVGRFLETDDPGSGVHRRTDLSGLWPVGGPAGRITAPTRCSSDHPSAVHRCCRSSSCHRLAMSGVGFDNAERAVMLVPGEAGADASFAAVDASGARVLVPEAAVTELDGADLDGNPSVSTFAARLGINRPDCTRLIGPACKEAAGKDFVGIDRRCVRTRRDVPLADGSPVEAPRPA